MPDLAADLRRRSGGQGRAVRPGRRQPQRGDLDRSDDDATIWASPEAVSTDERTGGQGDDQRAVVHWRTDGTSQDGGARRRLRAPSATPFRSRRMRPADDGVRGGHSPGDRRQKILKGRMALV